MADTKVTEFIVEHTPGPWRQDTLIVVDRDGNTVAHCTRWTRDTPMPDVAAANARLIAAAPDLLDALKAILSRHEGYQDGLGPCVCEGHVAGRAAIAKVEGR